MAAVRFSTTYISSRGVSRTIEIFDADYSGASTDFETRAGGFGISYSESGDEWPGQFMATQCEFVMLIQNSTHHGLITDFSTSPEGRFMLRIKEGSTLVWTGNILTDSTSYDEAPYPYDLKIRATDGIGTLKDIDFSDDGDPYTGKNKIIEYVTRCLSKISYVSTMYSGTDVFLRTSVDWWEETMTNSSSGADAWNFAYLDNSVYYKFDKGVQKYRSCYEVLKDILTAFECTLTYANGAFWIHQVSYRETTTIVQRNWRTSGVFINSTNYSDLNAIAQNAAGALLAVGEYDYTAGILEARHEFNANERRNFVAAKTHFDETDSVKTYFTPIHGNSDTTTLRLTGSLVLRISSDVSDPTYMSPFAPFVATFRINLFLDTFGLVRQQTLTVAHQVIYSPMEWDNTPGFYIALPISGPFMANTTSDIFTFTQTLDAITPFIPENCDSFSFSIQLESLNRYDGGTYNLADFTITYDLDNIWLEAYSYGTPVLSEDSHEYVTQSGEPTNTYVHKSESLIGSSFNPNTLGAIWVIPASTYILAEKWGAGVVTPAYDYMGQLLTTIMASMRALPTRRLHATLRGDIVALSLVYWETKFWLLIGGRWDSDKDELQGTWLLITHTDGLSPSPPVKTVKALIGLPNTQIPGIPTGTTTTGGQGLNPLATPLGTILNPCAQTFTSTDIRAGAITSIPIAHTLADNDFNIGDTVAIVDPFTGYFEDLVVNADSVSGQTAISVTADTLLLTYPLASPVIKKPLIGGGSSLPGGVTGQILRRTGAKWLGYGTSAIVDGWVLTWTDAGGWLAAAPPGGSGTVTSVAATQPAAGFTISGSPITTSGTFVFVLANDLAALEGLASTGIAVRSATDTWVQRLIAGTTNRITLTDGNGVSGNPTIDIAATYVGQASITTLGTIATGVWNGTDILFAAIQQIATASILGRVTGATGDIEVLTSTQATTLINVFTSALKGLVPASGGGTTNFMRADGTWAAPVGTGVTQSGTLVNNRITISAGSNQVKDFAAFTVDGVNDRMTVTGTVAGTGANNAFFNLNAGAITGATEFLRASGNINGNMIAILNNVNNSVNANTLLQIVVGGTSAGDPILQFTVTGGAGTVAVGLDNSDGDKFKITPNSSTPGGTANSGLIITQAATPLVGINKDVPVHALDVTGRVKGSTGFVGTFAQWAAGNIAFGTGAGTGPVLNSISGTDNALYLSFTTGTTPTNNATILTGTYPNAWPNSSFVTFSADGTNNSATNLEKFRTGGRNAIKFDFIANGTLPASTNFQFCFTIWGI